MTGTTIHASYLPHIERTLSALGHRPRRLPPRSGADWLVGGLRVRLIVARRTDRDCRVRAGGREYRYRYGQWNFNLHRHGSLDQSWDVAICVGEGREDTLVIPRRDVDVLAIQRHDGQRARGSRWDRYAGNWGVLG